MNLQILVENGMDNDIPETDGFYEILNYLGVNGDLVEAEEVLFCFDDVEKLLSTHLGNNHLNILFSRLQSAFENIGLKTDYFINAIDSHFYFNGDMQNGCITCLDDYLALELSKVA